MSKVLLDDFILYLSILSGDFLYGLFIYAILPNI